jgi:hypothetical protein
MGDFKPPHKIKISQIYIRKTQKQIQISLKFFVEKMVIHV